MGSSAQNSSGVHWCRRRVRFNEVPEKVSKVPEKVWEALVQSQVGSTGFWSRFRKRFRRSGRLWCRARSGSTGFRRRFPEKVWEALVQSQVRFNRVPEQVPEKVPEVWEALVQSQVRFNRVPEKVPGGFGAEPGQVQQGSGEGSGEGSREGLEGFGAEPGQVQQGSEKVPEKAPGSLGAKPSQVQRVSEKVAETKPGQVHLTHGNPAERVFPVLGFPARFRKICKNETDTSKAYFFWGG